MFGVATLQSVILNYVFNSKVKIAVNFTILNPRLLLTDHVDETSDKGWFVAKIGSLQNRNHSPRCKTERLLARGILCTMPDS